MQENKERTQADLIIRTLAAGLLGWYPFPLGSRVLYIGEETDALAQMLSAKELTTTVASVNRLAELTDVYDYIICIESLEHQKDPVSTLLTMKDHLAPHGVLLLGLNNRLGIRYFCGDRDPYTNWNVDSLDNYRHAFHRPGKAPLGRMYAKAEIHDMLESAGFSFCKFFSVLSDLRHPVLLFSEEFTPREDLAGRIVPCYHYAPTIFLEEESLYQALIENGLFHSMANSFLIECTIDGVLSDALQVTNSLERSHKNAMITTIHANHTVTKQAIYPEGEERLKVLFHNMEILKERGIPVIDGRLEKNVYIMPYIEADTGQLYLKKLLLRGEKEKFLHALDNFRDLILSSSENLHEVYHSPMQEWQTNGPVSLLRHACLDLVPLNSFYLDGKFVFYDQEFAIENGPVNLLLTRMIATFYGENMGKNILETILPAREVYDRYGISEQEMFQWLKEEWAFLGILRNESPLAPYYKKIRRNNETLQANRQQMNYAAGEYRRIFIDALENADTRKLILFGSGRFAQRFLDAYGADYPVYAIIDNNERRWGEKMEGIAISSPEILKKFSPGEYKVLVCVKDALPIMQQLDDMDIRDYGVFETDRMYRRNRHPIPPAPKGDQKKYHVGYIAGVFDLFHIGHLNLLRRAKEQCDYLLVGVVSDRGVRENKKVEPFVPFEERMEMVKSCRYVDEVVEIPFVHCDTEDAWRMHRFDAQFSGSDYEHDARWLEKKAFLEKHGAEMVFFPYTESTSSTRLKRLIEKKLI